MMSPIGRHLTSKWKERCSYKVLRHQGQFRSNAAYATLILRSEQDFPIVIIEGQVGRGSVKIASTVADMSLPQMRSRKVTGRYPFFLLLFLFFERTR